jgi:hypothetical protein
VNRIGAVESAIEPGVLHCCDVNQVDAVMAVCRDTPMTPLH